MGTKLPSSNWSAEKIGKLLTSAGILYARTNAHIHTHGHFGPISAEILGQHVLWSSIRSFIHLLFPGSSLTSSSIGLNATVRDPNIQNRPSTHTHTLSEFSSAASLALTL